MSLLEEQNRLLQGLKQESRRSRESSGGDAARLRLIIAYILFAAAYFYPVAARIAADPIGAATGKYNGTDPIFSKEVQEDIEIAGYLVTSGYGARNTGIEGASTDHKGVDLGTPIGTQLYMVGVGEGKVTCDNQPEGAGLYATIEPQGIPYTFRAFHLSKCEPGAYKPGQVFALTGETGVGDGPHLHWEQMKDGENLHPTEGYVWWVLQGEPPKDYAGEAIEGFGDADNIVQQIMQQESGGDSTIINPDSGALGKYQFMPDTIALYAPECIGRVPSNDEFLSDPSLQDQIMSCYLAEGLKQAKERSSDPTEICKMVASFHYAGDVSLYNSTAAQAGGYPSIAQYATEVCE